MRHDGRNYERVANGNVVALGGVAVKVTDSAAHVAANVDSDGVCKLVRTSAQVVPTAKGLAFNRKAFALAGVDMSTKK